MNHAKPSGKLLHLEIMRVFAVYFVMFNHTSGSGYMMFTRVAPGSLHYWAYLLLSIFCKFSVSLFLMISGALLLPKEPDRLGPLFKKRVLKMSVLLFVVSLLYYCRTMLLTPDGQYGIRHFCETLYASETSRHLWYLYMYLAFLLILPFLQALVKNLRDEHFVFMILLSIVTSCISLMEALLLRGQLHLNSHFAFTWIPDIILYPCVGYYLEHRLTITKKNTLAVWILNAVCLASSAYLTYYYKVNPSSDISIGDTFFHKRFVLVNAISIYMCIKLVSQNIRLSPSIDRLLLSMGSCTFGIYLIHKAVMASPHHHAVMRVFKRFIGNPMLACLAYCLFVLFFCYLLILLLKKIPVIKNYI